MTQHRAGPRVHFFAPSPFIRWTLTPVLLAFAAAVLLMVEVRSIESLAFLSVLAGGPILYALFLISPRRFPWAGRVVAGMVFLAYAAYLIDMVIFTNGPVGIGSNGGEPTPWNALLGFLIIGVPCAKYALSGRLFGGDSTNATDPPILTAPMRFDVEAADVEAELARYVEDPSPKNAEAQSIAREHHALPIMLDWTGPVLLHPDGRVLLVDWDDPAEATDHVNVRWRHIFQAHGSIQFPRIRGLAPVRGPADPTCDQCKGTGHPMIEGKPVHESVLCACGGVGWLPADQLTAPPLST